MAGSTSIDPLIRSFLKVVTEDWGIADIKFLEDVKREIKSRIDARTGRTDFEFGESDDAAIVDYMDGHPDFVRATFGGGRYDRPSWRRGTNRRVP
jgi:hypothetical protein